jgi:thiol-disulfide isomerase/thioredoxin
VTRGRLGVGLAVAAALGGAADARAGSARDVLQLPVRRGSDATAPLATLLGGAPAVVAFWATYCPPCRAEVPVLGRAAGRWRARGVRIVGVALDVRDAAALERAAREWGIEYETYWVPAEARDAAEALAPAGLPAAFFVGPTDVVRHDRLLQDDELDALVGRHLGVAALPPAPDE